MAQKSLFAFLLALCATSASAQEVVNIYNSRHYASDKQLYEAFTKATGIQVNVVEGKHEELMQRLTSEGAKSPADVLITVDAGRLAQVATENLLQPVSTAVLEKAIPAHLRHPDGLWYGLAVRARVLVYAKGRINPAQLSTYEALAEPQFKGQILTRSSNNSYTLSLVGSILAANGPEKTEAWAKGLVANFARPPEGGDTDQIKAVAAGQGGIALANTYYLGKLIASSKPEDQAVAQKVAAFFPNQKDRGTHVNISGAGVAKHAPHRENAIKLIEYLATDGQRYFADVNFEYPVNPAMKPHPILASFGGFKQDTLNAATYAANSIEAAKIMDRAGWK
ncbi:MAG: Fe(3+) ABC transporter substrate-binding protein [Synechococcaceae cyanobacterium SM1_2_3]|nr:Fe(3+) ABC transporter substrate-binding protein [Synechococcaceae cyanobacterium SM1_2_3]